MPCKSVFGSCLSGVHAIWKTFFTMPLMSPCRLSYVYFFSWTLRSPFHLKGLKLPKKTQPKKSPLHPWVPLYYPCISWDKELTWDKNSEFYWKISIQNVDFESRSSRGNGNSSSCIYAWSRAKDSWESINFPIEITWAMLIKWGSTKVKLKFHFHRRLTSQNLKNLVSIIFSVLIFKFFSSIMIWFHMFKLWSRKKTILSLWTQANN